MLFRLVQTSFRGFLFAYLSIVSSFAAMERPGLSLQEVIHLATEHSVAMKINESNWLAAQSQWQAQQYQRWPSLDMHLGYQYEKNKNQKDDFPLGTLTLKYDLLDLERYYLSKKETSERDLQKLKKTALDRGILREVTLQYYRLATAIERKQAIKDLRTRIQAQIQSVKQRQRAGKATGSDLYFFQLEITQLDSELAAMETKGQENERALALHLPPTIKTIEPTDSLPHFHLANSNEELLGFLADSPHLQQDRLKQEQAYFSTRAQSMARLPQIKLKAEAGYFEPDFSLEENKPQAEFRVLLSWDLFPGALSRSASKAKQYRWQTEKLHHELAGKELKSTIATLLDEIRVIQKRVDIERSRVDLARKLYRAVSLEYKRGVKSSEAVEAASKAIYEAQIADINYRLRFVEKVKEVEKILGKKVSLTSH